MPKAGVPRAGIFKNTVPAPTKAPEQRPAPIRRIVVKPKKPAVPPPAPVEDETEGDETEEQDGSSTEELEDEEEQHEVARQPAQPVKITTKPRTTPATQRQRRSIASEETDGEDWAPAAPAQKGARRRSLSRASSNRLQHRALGANERLPQGDRKTLIDKVVEVAVDEALAHFRYPTAWALRTLYDENSANQDFLDMVDKVFSQSANAETLEAFARLVQDRKREGRKKDQAYHYFVPPSNNSRAVPLPKQAPYGSLVKFDLTTLRLDRGARKAQKAPRSVKASEPEPEPEPERETKPEAEGGPSRKKRKLRRQPSGTSSSSSKMTSTDGASSKATMETTSRRQTRARSESTSSSLSSARSLSPPPEIQTDAEGEGFEGRDDPPSRNSPTSAQPITATKRRRSNAPRKGRNVSPSRPSSLSTASTPAPQLQASTAATSQQKAPSQRQHPADELPSPESDEVPYEVPYEMPAVVDCPVFPNLNNKRGGKSHTGTPVPVPSSAVGRLDPNDPKVLLRENARKVTNMPCATSNVRGVEAEGPVTPAPAATTIASSRPRASLPSGRQTPAPREGRSTRSALKRSHDDLEEQPSPTAANFPASEAASTAADSRAGTPALRAAKKPRTGLRVKNS
jgi:hypothetical protein